MKKKKKGFTLVELVVAMTISAIVITIIFTIFVTNSKMLSSTEIKSQMQTDGEAIINRMTKDGAQGIYVSGMTLTMATGTTLNKDSTYREIHDLNNSGEFSVNNLKITIAKDYDIGNPNKVTWKNSIFKLNSENELIYEIEGNPGSSLVLGKNVESIEVKVLGVEDTPASELDSIYLKDATAIEVKISLKRKKGTVFIDHEISNIIYFRNNQFKNSTI